MRLSYEVEGRGAWSMELGLNEIGSQYSTWARGQNGIKTTFSTGARIKGQQPTIQGSGAESTELGLSEIVNDVQYICNGLGV